jgi:electron transport complex protein RnfG
MKNILKLSLSLGLVCLLAATILSVADKLTEEPRKEIRSRMQQKALKSVLPDFDNNPLKNPTVITIGKIKCTFYPATQNGQLIGYAAKTYTNQGYGGRLSIMTGIKPDGTIIRTLVTKHTETPGLGTQVTDRKQQRSIWPSDTGEKKENPVPPNNYLDQYNGLNALDRKKFQVKKDGGKIQAVTGATISSRAVADAQTTIAKAFTKLKQGAAQK